MAIIWLPPLPALPLTGGECTRCLKCSARPPRCSRMCEGAGPTGALTSPTMLGWELHPFGLCVSTVLIHPVQLVPRCPADPRLRNSAPSAVIGQYAPRPRARSCCSSLHWFRGTPSSAACRSPLRCPGIGYVSGAIGGACSRRMARPGVSAPGPWLPQRPGSARRARRTLAALAVLRRIRTLAPARPQLPGEGNVGSAHRAEPIPPPPPPGGGSPGPLSRKSLLRRNAWAQSGARPPTAAGIARISPSITNVAARVQARLAAMALSRRL